MSTIERYFHQLQDAFWSIEQQVHISEIDANRATIWAVAIAFPIAGIIYLYLAQVMRHNTTIRTKIGDWLVRMTFCTGVALFTVGIAYGLAIFVSYNWITIPLWGRWLIRIFAVFGAVVSSFSGILLVRHLVPLLQSPFRFDPDEREWRDAKTWYDPRTGQWQDIATKPTETTT